MIWKNIRTAVDFILYMAIILCCGVLLSQLPFYTSSQVISAMAVLIIAICVAVEIAERTE